MEGDSWSWCTPDTCCFHKLLCFIIVRIKAPKISTISKRAVLWRARFSQPWIISSSPFDLEAFHHLASIISQVPLHTVNHPTKQHLCFMLFQLSKVHSIPFNSGWINKARSSGHRASRKGWPGIWKYLKWPRAVINSIHSEDLESLRNQNKSAK